MFISKLRHKPTRLNDFPPYMLAQRRQLTFILGHPIFLMKADTKMVVYKTTRMSSELKPCTLHAALGQSRLAFADYSYRLCVNGFAQKCCPTCASARLYHEAR
jgi:hypothetical protein